MSGAGRPRLLDDQSFISLWRRGLSLKDMERQLGTVSYDTLLRMKTRLESEGKLAQLESERTASRENPLLSVIEEFAEIPEIQLWKAWQEKNFLRAASITYNLGGVQAVWKILNKKRPISITSDDVRGAIVEHKKTHTEGSGFQLALGFRSFYRWLSQEGENEAIRNSAKSETLMFDGATKKLKSKDLHCTPEDYYTREEFAALHKVLVDWGEDQVEAAADISVTTATRKGGIVNLRVRDVNFSTGHIQTLEKGGKWWDKTPSPHALQKVRELIQKRGLSGDDKIFSGVSNFNDVLKRAGKAAGILKTMFWHKFRHTFATWCFTRKIMVAIINPRTREVEEKEIYAPIAAKVVCKKGGWDDEGTMLKFYASVIPEQEADLMETVAIISL